MNNERQAVINAWLCIAKRYLTNPYLILEFLNEPYNGNPILTNNASGYSLDQLTDNYVAFSQQAISTLRANGIKSLISLDAAFSSAPYFSATYFPDVNDQNTIWERHAYAPTISEWKSCLD